ncbi:MAG: biotin--[acetyl-CoA-carboxylase] ligase, partial [Microthrixaceae bacterium]
MGFSRAKADLAGTRFSDLRWVAETGSTNDDVQAAMTSPDPARSGELVIVADHQRAGRGRLGRTWEAPRGASLLMTVGTHETIAPASRGLLLAVMSNAARQAVREVTGVDVLLKWPNDLVVRAEQGSGKQGSGKHGSGAQGSGSHQDLKVAGVLAESFGLADGSTAYAVGIGINCNWGELPGSLRSIAASLDGLSGRAVDREELAVETVLGFESRLGTLGDRPGDIVEESRHASATLGCEVVAHISGSEVRGRAVDLDSDGALLVDTGGPD